MKHPDISPNWISDFEWTKFDVGSYHRNLMLYSIGLSMKAKTIVNIGIGQQPNGVYLLGQLAKQTEGELIAIDIAQTPIGRAEQIIEKYDLPVKIIRYDSKAISWGGKIDLLYIDGGHNYDQVSGDLENFSRHVRRNGYMILDDYGKRHLEVTEAVDEYLKAYSGGWEVSHFPQLWWMICRRL